MPYKFTDFICCPECKHDNGQSVNFIKIYSGKLYKWFYHLPYDDHVSYCDRRKCMLCYNEIDNYFFEYVPRKPTMFWSILSLITFLKIRNYTTKEYTPIVIQTLKYEDYEEQ